MLNPYKINLSDAERAVLEAARSRLGLRSGADVIRAWLAREVAEGSAELGHLGPKARDQ